MKKGEKKNSGLINAYILNLMRFYEKQAMNEYELTPKINHRFTYHLRANEVYKLHIKPLIERHWLIQIKNNGIISYIRIGKIRHVKAEETLKDQFYPYTEETYPEETLKDQFYRYPEDLWDYMAEYYSQEQVIREMWESDSDNFMTEKQALEYWTKQYEEYLKNKNLYKN